MKVNKTCVFCGKEFTEPGGYHFPATLDEMHLRDKAGLPAGTAVFCNAHALCTSAALVRAQRGEGPWALRTLVPVTIQGQIVHVPDDEIESLIKQLRQQRHALQQRSEQQTGTRTPAGTDAREAIFDGCEGFLVFAPGEDGDGFTLSTSEEPGEVTGVTIGVTHAAEVKLFHLLRDRHKARQRAEVGS